MLNYLPIIILGYLIGSFQPAYILGKLIKRVDIRKSGSGNSGASNAVIALGWKYGVLVALLDIGKAIISLLFVKYSYGAVVTPSQLQLLLFINGLAVIVGHNHPFYMGFKGGKGTASLVGMLIAIDIRLALLCGLAILIVTVISDYIALGTIAMVTLFFILTIYFNYGLWSILIAFFIAAMSIYKHIPNIIKISKGLETGLRATLNKPKKI